MQIHNTFRLYHSFHPSEVFIHEQGLSRSDFAFFGSQRRKLKREFIQINIRRQHSVGEDWLDFVKKVSASLACFIHIKVHSEIRYQAGGRETV